LHTSRKAAIGEAENSQTVVTLAYGLAKERWSTMNGENDIADATLERLFAEWGH
jgi:hypothetical protein